MGLMGKRRRYAALVAMVLCGFAMPVMAESDTSVTNTIVNEAVGLDAPNGEVLTKGDGTVITGKNSSVLSEGDKIRLYSYGIRNNTSIVTLGKEAQITAKGHMAQGIYTYAEGAKTTLGDSSTVEADSSGDQPAYGVVADHFGTNILGKESHITAVAPEGLGESTGLVAKDEGTNNVGDGTQIKATNEKGLATGVNADNGMNNLGENINISATASNFRAVGISTSGSKGETTAGDYLVVKAEAQNQNRGEADGISSTSQGKVTIGQHASITATSHTTGIGLRATGDSIIKAKDYAEIYTEGYNGIGIFTDMDYVSSESGNVDIGRNASITVKAEDIGTGISNASGGKVNVGDNATIKVEGAEDNVAVKTWDNRNTTSKNSDTKTIIGKGAEISVTGDKQDTIGNIGVYTTVGYTEIGDDATITATAKTGKVSGVETVLKYPALGSQTTLKDHVSVTAKGETAYGVESEGNTVIGTDANIRSVTTEDGNQGAGIYSTGGSIEIGSRAVVTAEGSNAVGVLVRGVSRIVIIPAGSTTGNQVENSAGKVTFMGSAWITGNLYSLWSQGDGRLIDLSASGRKVISGDILSSYGGIINVRMDTADSLFTGASLMEKGGVIVIIPTGSGDQKAQDDLVQDDYGEINLTMSNGARWNMTGDSTVTNFTLNSGAVVNMTANPDYQTLTVGNFSGNNGIFFMKSDLETQAADQSDKVAITTAAAGSSGRIQVSDASFARGSEVTGLRHQLLVTDASENATFTGEKLDTGGLWDVTPTIENGLNVYDAAGNVVGTKNEWYLTKLTKTVNDDTRPLVYSGDSTYAMYRRSIDTLRQRRGNLRQRGKTDDDGGIWVRSRGGQMEGDGWDSRYNIFQLGYEYSDNPGSVYGFFAERGIASPDYGTGRGKEHTLSGGIYGTWYGEHGRYTDIVAKIGRDDTRIDTYGPYPDKANYRTGEKSLSIEHGRTLYRGKDKSFFIEPQVQLVLGHLNDTSYTTERGTHVERDSLNSAIGRLGIVLGKTKDNGEHPYDYYLKASLLHEFGGSQDIHLRAANGETLDTGFDYGETWVEVGLGGTYRFNANTMAYADIERSYSSNLTEKWQINAGISWQF